MKQWENKEFISADLVKQIKEKKILVPQYQRGQVWKEKDQEKLIDSIKKGFPFGTILLYYNSEDQKYRLIDGLQRCTTISKYLNNPSKIFNKDFDIDKKVIVEIIDIQKNVAGNKKIMQSNISSIIEKWVLTSHKTMSDINNMQYSRCAREITKEFPMLAIHSLEIEDLIEPMLNKFKMLCDDLSSANIPAIVYKGPQENLPEIFTRINSQGTQLSKYQILAATWSHIDYKVSSDELSDIHSYVEKYFTNLFLDDDSFTPETINRDKDTFNLFQIIFGFSKILSDKYQYLFNSTKESEVESSGFNLITACLGLKNSDMKFLDKRLQELFKTDEEFNTFLEKILIVTKRINKILYPYISFKNNSRDGSKIIHYHTEMQICSIIANSFIVKHASFSESDFSNSFKINLEKNSPIWQSHAANLSINLMKRYTVDILNNNWSGSGDNRLNDVVKQEKYYSGNLSKQNVLNSMNAWYSDYKDRTQERMKISNPKPKDKLINAIVYSNIFTTRQALDETRYDNEHIATKELMRKHLTRFDTNNNDIHLPLSSIGNICLLPEFANRRKREGTLYQDKYYINAISESDLKLSEVENKYTFTKEKDLLWIEDEEQDFETLRKNYINFIDNRFQTISDKVISALYDNKYS